MCSNESMRATATTITAPMSGGWRIRSSIRATIVSAGIDARSADTVDPAFADPGRCVDHRQARGRDGVVGDHVADGELLEGAGANGRADQHGVVGDEVDLRRSD